MSRFFRADKVQFLPEPVVAWVEEQITPNQAGRVSCQGSSSPAQFYSPHTEFRLLPNEAVSVIGTQGITLLVERLRA